MPSLPEDTAAVTACLERLAAGDLTARDRLLELQVSRLRALARRMLAAYPNVRRWEDTDDVFQNAAVRLHRALAAVTPQSPRELLALAATQLHRELVDLARRHAGPRSPAAHHATNLVAGGNAAAGHLRVDRAAAPDDGIDRWEAFHEAIAALSPDDREVFRLVWYLGADQETVARLLACSPRTVKNRWRRAREAVRAALDGLAPA